MGGRDLSVVNLILWFLVHIGHRALLMLQNGSHRRRMAAVFRLRGFGIVNRFLLGKACEHEIEHAVRRWLLLLTCAVNIFI